MKLNEMDSLFSEFLIGDYNLHIHSETNIAPRDRWPENASVPRLPESLEQLDLLLLTVTKARKVHPDRIHFHRFKYIDTTLAAYVGEEVIIRYDPRDMAEIRVYYKDSFLCRAISQELARETISLKDIIKARNARRNQLKGQIKSRSEMVDLLLSVHCEDSNEDSSSIEGADVSSQANNTDEAKPKLKRYYNE